MCGWVWVWVYVCDVLCLLVIFIAILGRLSTGVQRFGVLFVPEPLHAWSTATVLRDLEAIDRRRVDLVGDDGHQLGVNVEKHMRKRRSKVCAYQYIET